MPQCEGTKKNGQRCSRAVRDGETHCHQHKPAEAVAAVAAVPMEFRCKGVTHNLKQCTNRSGIDVGFNDHFCGMHDRYLVDEANAVMFAELLDTRIIMVDAYHLVHELDVKRELKRNVLRMNAEVKRLTVSRGEHIVRQRLQAIRQVMPLNPLIDQGRHRVQLAFHARHEAEAVNIPIGADTQSIHRREVSAQTNALMDKLFGNNEDSFKEDTFGEVAGWIGATVNGRLWRDMLAWYNQPFCKKENDWFYRRTLNAVVHYARMHKEHEELRKRITEETTESIGMCCEGHLARLCNALVGFHEDAVSAVSPAELLQDRMAALAARGGTEEEAREILRELAIPEDQWAPWLEAL